MLVDAREQIKAGKNSSCKATEIKFIVWEVPVNYNLGKINFSKDICLQVMVSKKSESSSLR